jgi:hypothetical protein
MVKLIESNENSETSETSENSEISKLEVWHLLMVLYAVDYFSFSFFWACDILEFFHFGQEFLQIPSSC